MSRVGQVVDGTVLFVEGPLTQLHVPHSPHALVVDVPSFYRLDPLRTQQDRGLEGGVSVVGTFSEPFSVVLTLLRRTLSPDSGPQGRPEVVVEQDPRVRTRKERDSESNKTVYTHDYTDSGHRRPRP